LRSFRDAHNTKCGGSKFAPPLGIRRFLKGGSQNRERARAASAIPSDRDLCLRLASASGEERFKPNYSTP
jgi:hypothetical protein